MRTRRSVAGVVAVALAGALAACGGGGGTAETSSATTADPVTIEPTTTTARPTTTTTVVSEEEAVLAAYQGYWSSWLAAADPPNPEYPDLERYYSSTALQRVRSALQRQRSVGEIIRIPPGALYRHDARA